MVGRQAVQISEQKMEIEFERKAMVDSHVNDLKDLLNLACPGFFSVSTEIAKHTAYSGRKPLCIRSIGSFGETKTTVAHLDVHRYAYEPHTERNGAELNRRRQYWGIESNGKVSYFEDGKVSNDDIKVALSTARQPMSTPRTGDNHLFVSNIGSSDMDADSNHLPSFFFRCPFLLSPTNRQDYVSLDLLWFAQWHRI
jgi:hypothetical protein